MSGKRTCPVCGWYLKDDVQNGSFLLKCINPNCKPRKRIDEIGARDNDSK